MWNNMEIESKLTKNNDKQNNDKLKIIVIIIVDEIRYQTSLIINDNNDNS